MSLSKEHTCHNLQAWAKCQLPGWGWRATWPGLLYPALQNWGCLSSLSQSPQGSGTPVFHVHTFMNAFQNFRKLQQGYSGLFYTRDFQNFWALVGIFLHNCLLTWDFNIRHTEYLLWTLGIVELHRKTGQEFSTPRAVFSPWNVMELLENVVFPLYTLSNFPLMTYMCIELTNIHILMYVHKYMYVYIIYMHIYNYSKPFEKKNIMILPYNTLQKHFL